MKSIREIFVPVLITLSLVANGQDKLSVAFRPSFNMPTENLGTTELKQGGGFEATFVYNIMPQLGTYAGWGWNTFSPEVSGPVAHFEETGYRLGLQYFQPLSQGSNIDWIVSGGIVVNHIESENDEGDIIDDSGHGIGWEAEAALSFPLSQRWKIVPGVRYHALSREVTYAGIEEAVDLNYVSFGVAVRWTLISK